MWFLVLMITTEDGSENQAQASTVLGQHTRSCLRSDTSLSLACGVAIKSCALSLIDADHASLAACQVVCHLSWRIVLCDGTLHSSTSQVSDNPHKLITPAKSAASCARLWTTRAIANSSWQDFNWMFTWLSILQAIKCTCSCRTAYTRSGLKLLKANRRTGKRLLQRNLYGWTTHHVQEDETSWGLQLTAIGENFHMCPGKALCNHKRLLDASRLICFDCILNCCPTVKVECLVLHWTLLLLNLM